VARSHHEAQRRGTEIDMRKLLIGVLLAIAGVGPALAGGMGDPSAHIKDMNRICEMQKRGEGPLSPNLCLPEYPPPPVETQRRR
jgi:hypothetical protein